MLKHLQQRAAISATNDKDISRVHMRVKCWVREHLVVEEIVSTGEHDAAVDDHQVAKVRGVIYFYVLVRRALVVQFSRYLQRKGTAFLGVKFRKPLLVEAHRSYPVAVFEGGKLYHKSIFWDLQTADYSMR
jgi:hypothetical protein